MGGGGSENRAAWYLCGSYLAIPRHCNTSKSLEILASPAGLEPATHSLGNCCSILLSYGDCVGFGELVSSVPVRPSGGPLFATRFRKCACISQRGGPGQLPWGNP